jgi:FK506-binding nuclear protein
MRPSGILVTDYILGAGKEPKLGSRVRVTYEGMFLDGTVFDKNVKRSKPLVFRKGVGEVVRGLDHGLDGMRIGGAREIVVPSELA